MEIDTETVVKIARLSRIKINESETADIQKDLNSCLLYTSPSPRDYGTSRMPSSA